LGHASVKPFSRFTLQASRMARMSCVLADVPGWERYVGTIGYVVFPIRIPPLRERRGDIPLLVEHFTQKYARRMNKPIDTIPELTFQKLQRWSWPGNVRELENLIERSVILRKNQWQNLKM